MIMTRTLYLVAAGAALALVVNVATFYAGKRAGETRIQAQWNEAVRVQAEARAQQQAEHRDAERRWEEQLRETTDELHAKLVDLEAQASNTIDDLRAGNLRLQERFRACTATAAVPDAAGATSRNDAPDAGGLSESDALFLVRLAATADQVARQLSACQAYVRSITSTSQE